MGFLERSYSGRLFRPRPEIHLEGKGDLLIVATPWGPRTSAKKAIQVIRDYYNSSRNDMEATAPFAKLTCLSPVANELRIAVKLANDAIYNEDNKGEYVSGIELAVVARNDSEIAWVQIGHPYLFLDRPQKMILPLTGQRDLSSELAVASAKLSPLPAQLLGVEPVSDFVVGSAHFTAHDRLLLVSRSEWPQGASSLPPQDRTLETYSKILSNDDEDMPFWIGLLDL